MKTIKVVHQGLGSIGRETARSMLKDSRFEIVGAVDINKDYAGKDIGDLLGTEECGVEITGDAEELFKKTKPDVLVLTTSLTLGSIMQQLELAASLGINVVSPAEELFYPQFVDREKAERLDRLAMEHKVGILGTGVNPGCLMDAFPLKRLRELEGLGHADYASIVIYRWSNTAERRLPLLEKTGAGLSEQDFYRLNREGKLGHVGLKISAAYLAENLGFTDYKINFERKPVILGESRTTKSGKHIPEGHVAGIQEKCVVESNGKSICLDLRMFAGARNVNIVDISSESRAYRKVLDYSNIVNGDEATTRILKDAAMHVVKGNPGLNRVGYVPDPYVLLRK